MINIDHAGKVADFIASILNIEKPTSSAFSKFRTSDSAWNRCLSSSRRSRSFSASSKKISGAR
jgi:hypothetical protein